MNIFSLELFILISLHFPLRAAPRAAIQLTSGKRLRQPPRIHINMHRSGSTKFGHAMQTSFPIGSRPAILFFDGIQRVPNNGAKFVTIFMTTEFTN